jgi:hypothetical protein
VDLCTAYFVNSNLVPKLVPKQNKQMKFRSDNSLLGFTELKCKVRAHLSQSPEPTLNQSINRSKTLIKKKKQGNVPGHFPRQIVWREAWAATHCVGQPGPDDPNSSQSSNSDRAPAHTVASAPAGRTGQRPWTRVGNKKPTQKKTPKKTH